MKLRKMCDVSFVSAVVVVVVSDMKRLWLVFLLEILTACGGL